MTFRWVNEERERGDFDPMVDDVPAHANDHAPTWSPWTRGRSAARAILRRMARIARHQQDRDQAALGYLDVGEAGA